MKFPKLQKAIAAMRTRLGMKPRYGRPAAEPVEPIRITKKWNPNQRQRRKDNRRAFAAGNRKAFSH